MSTSIDLQDPRAPIASAYEELEAVDWSFSDRRRHSDMEALHPYPAKFISEIPRAIISALGLADGSAILDPFCGSGTTLAEAQFAGIPSYGIDLNPIACLISRVRTGGLISDAPEKMRYVLSQAQTESAEIPAIPNLDHWFKPYVQSALARLTRAIRNVGDACLEDLLSLALSSIIVRVSNQDSDTRYAAVDKKVSYDSVFQLFEKAVLRIASTLEARGEVKAPSSVIEGDILKVEASSIKQPIGLVVTSPPYPNAYEYWLYHKYRMWWLGKDPLAVKSKEIGARAHFFKKNHHTADDFARQMGGTLDLLSKVMKSGGHACFVVGRSKIHGVIVDNAKIIVEQGAKRGFNRVFAVEREIASTRKSFNLSHANIKTESVLALRFD